MTRTRVAVVGAGVMGTMHARACAECDAAELKAVVDTKPERAQEVASQYGAKGTSQLDEVLGDESVEAFIVALPDRRHVETTCKILETGKAVLLEKPMADSLEGAERIAALAQRANARLMVAHLLRFDPRYAEAARTVAGGEIGEPVHVAASRFSRTSVGRRLDGASSVCFYLGVHDVDAVQWVSGKRITRVYSRAVSRLMHELGVSSEDAIFSTCEFEDGSVGSLSFGWTMPDNTPGPLYATLEVVGTKGVVKVDVNDNGLRIVKPGAIAFPDGVHYPIVNDRISGDLRAEVEHFVTAVRDETEFLVPVEDAMSAVAVNDAILRSVKTARAETVEKPTAD